MTPPRPDPRAEPPTDPPDDPPKTLVDLSRMLARRLDDVYALLREQTKRLGALDHLPGLLSEAVAVREQVGRMESSVFQLGLRIHLLEKGAPSSPQGKGSAAGRPPASTSIAADLPPMVPSPRAIAQELAAAVRVDFERDAADHSSPPPGPKQMEAMVKQRAEAVIDRIKAANWDRLEAERKAAEDDRLALLREVEAERIGLAAQDARERHRLKWVAYGGVVTTGLSLLGMLVALLGQHVRVAVAQPPLPPAVAMTASRPAPGPAMVDFDGGPRPP